MTHLPTLFSFFYIFFNLTRPLRLPAWKVGDRGLEPYSGIQVLKEQICSSPLTRKNWIFCGASVTEM